MPRPSKKAMSNNTGVSNEAIYDLLRDVSADVKGLTEQHSNTVARVSGIEVHISQSQDLVRELRGRILELESLAAKDRASTEKFQSRVGVYLSAAGALSAGLTGLIIKVLFHVS